MPKAATKSKVCSDQLAGPLLRCFGSEDMLSNAVEVENFQLWHVLGRIYLCSGLSSDPQCLFVADHSADDLSAAIIAGGMVAARRRPQRTPNLLSLSLPVLLYDSVHSADMPFPFLVPQGRR